MVDKKTESEIESIKGELLETKPELIYQKIFNVMSNIERMPKDGDVAFKTTKYKYLSAEKIVENIRKEMIKQKLIIYPCNCYTDNTAGSEKDITITYKITAIEDGSFIDVQVTGGGHDSTDKKSYKAMTGAYKYALRQTFMIETGKDDPDRTPSGKGRKQTPTVDNMTDPFKEEPPDDFTDDVGKEERLCTDKQLKRMYAMMKDAGVEIDEWDAKIKKEFSIGHKKEMTMTQIDKVFDRLDKIIKQQSA